MNVSPSRPAASTRSSRPFFFLTILALLSCARPEERALLTVKRALAERDQVLSSYHFIAESTESGAHARHEFWYRAPNRSKGTLLEPQRLTVAFDGQQLFKLSPDEKKFETYDFKLPPAKAAYVLATTFQPFAPEGFRSPMLPSTGVRATRVKHARAPEAVEVTVDAGDGVTVTWVLRLPAGDVLEKRSGDTVISTEDEQCSRGVCVPRKLVTRRSGVEVGVVKLSSIELDVALPNTDFTLSAPEGFAREQHTFVEE